MKVYLINEEFFIENDEQGLQKLIDTINETLAEKDVFFSHMIIDGEEVYNEPIDYLAENLRNIKQIDVKVKTIEQFINDLFVSLNKYTYQAIPEIEKLVSDFYQKPSSASWNTLEQLFEGIQWIYQTIKNIDQVNKDHFKWDEYIKVTAIFEAELPNLMNAMESQDSVLIADIVQYEILPQFQLIYNTTEEMFDGIGSL